MLEQLYIENIAVIEKAEILLSSGLNVLTGETGAGKSIVIDSINAVLGERTSKELIRTGCNKASVSVLFTGLCDIDIQKLAELGFTPEEDGSVLLQRVLSADGKSSCRIGGKPATASILREIGKVLVNIHGQHDNQSLLNTDQHYQFLDVLADNGKTKSLYEQCYTKTRRLQRQLKDLDIDESEKLRRIDLLTYQIDELEKADISDGEMEQLRTKRLRYQNSEKIVLQLGGVVGALMGTDDADGLVTLLQSASRQVLDTSRYLDELTVSAERMSAIGYELEEIYDILRRKLEEMEYDPFEVEQIEERLDFLYRLQQKYGDSEEEMLDFLEKSKEELESITESEVRRDGLVKELAETEVELKMLAEQLTSSRIKAGQAFSKSVCEELSFLDMPGVKFIPEIKPDSYHITGADKVEFLISANPGEPPKSLSKIASGGELSRIMLAIKNVLAEKDAVPTLIFDEIDVGISGRAAQKIGIKLKEVSKNRQVICITHLAQIAAVAHQHMLIEKHVRNDRTYTSVLPLHDSDRVKEIARIMSGGKITEALIQTATELIEAGKKLNF